MRPVQPNRQDTSCNTTELFSSLATLEQKSANEKISSPLDAYYTMLDENTINHQVKHKRKRAEWVTVVYDNFKGITIMLRHWCNIPTSTEREIKAREVRDGIPCGLQWKMSNKQP
jgi:hypothetical protein